MGPCAWSTEFFIGKQFKIEYNLVNFASRPSNFLEIHVHPLVFEM
jgi:hypothetical protein